MTEAALSPRCPLPRKKVDGHTLPAFALPTAIRYSESQALVSKLDDRAKTGYRPLRPLGGRFSKRSLLIRQEMETWGTWTKTHVAQRGGLLPAARRPPPAARRPPTTSPDAL